MGKGKANSRVYYALKVFTMQEPYRSFSEREAEVPITDIRHPHFQEVMATLGTGNGSVDAAKLRSARPKQEKQLSGLYQSNFSGYPEPGVATDDPRVSDALRPANCSTGWHAPYMEQLMNYLNRHDDMVVWLVRLTGRHAPLVDRGYRANDKLAFANMTLCKELSPWKVMDLHTLAKAAAADGHLQRNPVTDLPVYSYYNAGRTRRGREGNRYSNLLNKLVELDPFQPSGWGQRRKAAELTASGLKAPGKARCEVLLNEESLRLTSNQTEPS